MNAEDHARAAAAEFRREHNLGHQPLGDLVTLIEQATGTDVAMLSVGPDEHGLTMRDPHRGSVFIAVACTGNPMRQRSTLAHELAHVLFEDWAGDPPAVADRSPEEIRADAFARHLLVPAEGLREFLGRDHRAIGTVTLSQVVQRFLVSPPIAAIALRQAGYIDTATKESWLKVTTPQLATRYGWADQYRALQRDSEQRRAPQRLLARAINGYLTGVVSAQTLATLRGTDVADIERELRDAGVTPAGPAVAWAEPEELPDVTVDLGDVGAGPEASGGGIEGPPR